MNIRDFAHAVAVMNKKNQQNQTHIETQCNEKENDRLQINTNFFFHLVAVWRDNSIQISSLNIFLKTNEILYLFSIL